MTSIPFILKKAHGENKTHLTLDTKDVGLGWIQLRIFLNTASLLTTATAGPRSPMFTIDLNVAHKK